MSALDDKIHRIVGDEIDEKIKPINADINEIKDKVHNAAVDMGKLVTKVDAMYGNGSGKIGILDEIRTEQKIVKKALEEDTDKNSKFRHEVRNYIETQQLRDSIQAEEVKKQEKQGLLRKADIKWILGGIAVIIWELIKSKFHI